MEKHVRVFLQTTLILLALGISVRLSAQPRVVTEVPVNSTGFVSVGDLVYFTSGSELWRTDGTAEGTFPLESGFAQPGFFTGFNGSAYFTNADNRELWKSDGTPAGTIRLHSSENNDLKILGQTNGYLFFQASNSPTGLELYRTDGTAGGTMMLRDISPGPANSLRGTTGRVLGNEFIFSADNGTNGTELWKSDGSSAGTVMIRDINAGPEHSVVLETGSFVYNNLFYFMGITDEHGAEPWVTDGTTEGTHLLKDINPGAAPTRNVRFAIGNDGYLYFLILDDYDAGPASLWKTAGTEASTSFIKVIGEGASDNNLYSFRVYQNKVYFWSHMDSYTDLLWVTDGTSEGTQIIFSVDTPEGSIHYFDVVNNHLLFTGSAQSFPTPFYRSDGTSAGTDAFWEFNAYTMPGDIIERIGVTSVGDFAFFADHDGEVHAGEVPADPADYFHLFQTDGFTTESMRTMYDVSTVGSDNITDFNGKVIFTTYDDQPGGTGGKQLWIYDPNSSGNEQAGKIQQEVWNDVPGTKVSAIPVNEPPSSISDLISFETPANIGDNYGSRVRGYIRAPETGDYTFWIASDDQGQLWLSTNDDPANKVKIAEVTGWTNSRQWDKYPAQQSTPISLVAGEKYYIEALFKEGAGRDHLAVGWQLPDGTLERPIAGAHLISFEGSDPGPACAGTGTILLETWTGIDSRYVSSIPVDSPPDFTGERTIFEAPTNVGNNFGSRARGYLCVPVTGDYTFWIASDDHGELWLSTDADPANKRRIAHVWGWTTPRQWTKLSTEQSAPISLVAGQQYYIEALYKEDEGGDNMAVGWQLPDGTMERPIPGSRLSPFQDAETTASETNSRLSPDDQYSQISIYPNPAKSGAPELTVSGYEGIEQAIETDIEIINMTGEVVYRERIRCGGDCSSYIMKVDHELVPGVYMVKMKTNGTRDAKRLLVR